MSVSVIIPVYNAMPYVQQAIQSALDQPETAEIIIVDDGSTDGSYAYVSKLAKQNSKVKLFIHHFHKNKGSSASRNLGIQMVQYPYIAFLDADDYYLKDRFKFSLAYLDKYPECLATAESIEVEQSKNNNDTLSTTIIPTIYAPENLFKIYALSKTLHFSLNGLTIRKSAFDEIAAFDISLLRVQDTDFIYRLAQTKKLHIPQVDHIVAKYRRDNINPLRNELNIRKNKALFHNKWYALMLQNNWDKEINRSLVKMYIYYNIPYPQSEKRLNRYLATLLFLLKNPKTLHKIF